MTASSHQTPGPMPPESPPAATPDQARATFAAYGVVLPVPVGTTYADPWDANPSMPYSLRSPFPEPVTEGPACVVCEAPAGVGETALYPDPAGRRYPSGAQVLYCMPHLPAPAGPVSVEEAAAAEVLGAVRAQQTDATSLDLAAAGTRAAILFDAAHVQEAVDAAVAQALAEAQVRLDERGEQLAVMTDAWRRQRDAVLRLCEGRLGTDLLLVSAVAVAVECGTTALDGLPMPLTWTGRVRVPDARTARTEVTVECVSSYGGHAELVVTGEQRAALANLVDSQARVGHEIVADEADDLDAQHGAGAAEEYALLVAEATEAGFEDERGDVDEAAGGAV